MGLGAVEHPLGSVPPRSPRCVELITRVAHRVAADTDELAERLVDRVAAEAPEIRARDDVREDLVRVARGCLTLLTAMTRSWSDPRNVPPPPEAVEWSRSLVRRGLPMDSILKAFRVGQAGYRDVWHIELCTEAQEDPEVLFEALRATSAFTFVWIDAIVAPLAAAYQAERERSLRGAHAHRVETIDALLAGELTDARTAGLRLGYDIDRPLVAFVVWSEDEPGDRTLEHLEELAVAVAPCLGASSSARPLLHGVSPRLLFGWTARHESGSVDLDDASAPARALGVRVAVGGEGAGADGFRVSHEEALAARRVARLLRTPAPVVRYEDVAVTDLLTRDPEAARGVARRVLGPLAQPDANSRRLLATLRVFLEEGQSYARAARRLGIHQNTIGYRVHRALELTGHGDGDPLELRAAVELSPLLEGDLDRA